MVSKAARAIGTTAPGTIPSRFLGDEPHHRCIARLFRKQVEPESNWILARKVCQFVDCRLHHVAGVSVAHGAKPQHGHGRFGIVHIDREIFYPIGSIDDALNRAVVQAVLHSHLFKWGSDEDRLADYLMLPRSEEHTSELQSPIH